ncbi:MAG: tripartite tricarboxylate transporter TctB family protein [Betaproteobacteria bacterium]|nr:tripartite tricarboxylate transporter TctB family protein [Betaproteobacteria bacterium]
MKLKNPKDFWSGVMFCLIGFAFAAVVKIYDYPMGTPARMGPGYFPFALALILGFLGVAIIIESMVTSGEAVSKFAWRPLFWVLGGFVVFGLTAKLLGLVIAIILLVVISSYGGHEFKWKEAIISSIILAVSSVAVFVYGLKLPFPIWPEFLG